MNQKNIGWLNGLIGVIIFAGSLPATRIAVSAFNPTFLTNIRAAIAGLFGLILLIFLKQKQPDKQQLISLCIVAIGVVFGFPWLTALALQTISSAHAIVFVGLLPLATATFAILRVGERPNNAFWLFTLLGSFFVLVYMFYQNRGFHFQMGDFYMLLAICICGLGYAEGGKLSHELGGWQVICWALVISLPITLSLSLYGLPSDFSNIPISAYLAVTYVSLFSMLLGFVFWYKGLALGGVAQIGQIQLIQPFLGFIFAGILLGESIQPAMIICCVITIICIILAKHFAH